MPPPRISIKRKRKGPLFTNMASSSTIQLIFYTLLLIGCATAIIVTCTSHPLFPIQSDNLEWNNAWLIATVIDYYGACLCLCGVILGTEQNWISGILWSLGCCLLGSPVCCIWIIVRLCKHGSLCLQDDTKRAQYPSIGGNID